MLVEGLISPFVAGADAPYVDLNAGWSTWDSFQCVISHSIARGHVFGNVDNVLHNFESVPCFTPTVQQINTDSWRFEYFGFWFTQSGLFSGTKRKY